MATAVTGCEVLVDEFGSVAGDVHGGAGDSSLPRTRGRLSAFQVTWKAPSAAALLGLSLAGCEPRETVDKDLYIAELEAQVTQLESDLNVAYQEVSRLSNNLTSQVTNLETSMTDLNLRILDLPGAADPAAAIREVEASMAVAMQRLTEVRGTTNTLAEYLQ